jgi:hypothetical protein
MSQVPSRQQWRAEEDSKSGSSLVQAMMAFGWIVHRHILPAGHRLVTRLAAPVPRALAPNLTLYVKGRASFTHEDGTVFDDRVPGMFSGDRPDTPAGVMTHAVLEDLEFWCFNWHANRGALPQVEVFRVMDAGSFNAPVGQRVILCAGTLGGYEYGTAFIHDGGALAASGDCYGFLVGGDRG